MLRASVMAVRRRSRMPLMVRQVCLCPGLACPGLAALPSWGSDFQRAGAERARAQRCSPSHDHRALAPRPPGETVTEVPRAQGRTALPLAVRPEKPWPMLRHHAGVGAWPAASRTRDAIGLRNAVNEEVGWLPGSNAGEE